MGGRQLARGSSKTTHPDDMMNTMCCFGGSVCMLQLCGGGAPRVRRAVGMRSQGHAHGCAFSQVLGSLRGKLTWGQSSGISIL